MVSSISPLLFKAPANAETTAMSADPIVGSQTACLCRNQLLVHLLPSTGSDLQVSIVQEHLCMLLIACTACASPSFESNVDLCTRLGAPV